jgi:predicted DNA-binding transcriptional regulator AlpA
MGTAMARRFARFKEMRERGYFANRMAAWRAVQNGFPPAYELGKNTIAWDLDEVEAYVATLPRRVPGSQPSLKRGSKPHRAIATEAV